MAGMIARRASREALQHGRRNMSLAAVDDSLKQGQNRVVDASLTLIRERARLKVAAPTLSRHFPGFSRRCVH